MEQTEEALEWIAEVGYAALRSMTMACKIRQREASEGGDADSQPSFGKETVDLLRYCRVQGLLREVHLCIKNILPEGLALCRAAPVAEDKLLWSSGAGKGDAAWGVNDRKPLCGPSARVAVAAARYLPLHISLLYPSRKLDDPNSQVRAASGQGDGDVSWSICWPDISGWRH